jgi:ABC-type Fe3+ transport system substrate-binding protein
MLIFDCGRDAALRYQKTGAPIGHAVPKEAIRDNVIDLGVPANAEHPNAGKLLVVFLHTEEGQELLWKYGAYDLEIYPGSHSKKLIDDFRSKYPNAKFDFETVQEAQAQDKEGVKVEIYQKKFLKILRGK